jgi:hypothetical protein
MVEGSWADEKNANGKKRKRNGMNTITEEQVLEYVNVMSSDPMFVLSILADIASGTYTPEQLKDDILGINKE